MKGVDIVNSLAHKAAFAEEILVGIGDGARIDVEGGIGREDGCQPRLSCRLQVHAGLRLQDGITALQLFPRRIEDRAIQGVRERADQFSRRVAGKLRVGIERNYVTHVLEQRKVADFHGKSVVLAAQKAVEVEQFARACAPSPSRCLRRRSRPDDDGSGRTCRATAAHICDSAVRSIESKDGSAGRHRPGRPRESTESVSSAKWRFLSRFPRKRTSSASTIWRV